MSRFASIEGYPTRAINAHSSPSSAPSPAYWPRCAQQTDRRRRTHRSSRPPTPAPQRAGPVQGESHKLDVDRRGEVARRVPLRPPHGVGTVTPTTMPRRRRRSHGHRRSQPAQLSQGLLLRLLGTGPARHTATEDCRQLVGRDTQRRTPAPASTKPTSPTPPSGKPPGAASAEPPARHDGHLSAIRQAADTGRPPLWKPPPAPTNGVGVHFRQPRHAFRKRLFDPSL